MGAEEKGNKEWLDISEISLVRKEAAKQTLLEILSQEFNVEDVFFDFPDSKSISNIIKNKSNLVNEMGLLSYNDLNSLKKETINDIAEDVLKNQGELIFESFKETLKHLKGLSLLKRMYNETESVFDNLETVHYKAFAEALLELEERYISKEDWKKAEAMLIIAEDFVKKVTGAIKPRLHATMDAKWGIYLWKCGDYIEAEKKLQKANAGVLELIKKHGDEIKNENDIEKNNYLYARILQGFGTLYGDLLADKTQAIDYNQKCLKQLGKTKRTYRTQRMETSVLNNLGVAYHKMAELSTDKREENLKEAVKYYEKAMTLSRGISHLTMTGWLLFNAGEVYALLGEFEKAETCSLESRKIFSEEKPSERGMSGVEMLDAVIYLQKNMYPDAMASINKSIALREKLGEPRRIADALACRGDVYVGLGNKLKANEDYQQANKLYTTIGSQDGINKTEEKIKALS